MRKTATLIFGNQLSKALNIIRHQSAWKYWWSLNIWKVKPIWNRATMIFNWRWYWQYTLCIDYISFYLKKKKLVEVLTPQKKMFERLLGWCSVSVHFSIVAEHLTERKEPWKFCLTYHYNEHQITTICYWQSNAFTIISCYYEHNNGGFLQCFESEKKLIIFSEVTDTKAKHLNYAQYKIPQPPTNKCSHCSKMHITFKSVWIYKFKQKQQVAVEVYILLHAWWSLAVVCFYYLQKFYTSLFVETVYSHEHQHLQLLDLHSNYVFF